ncbi:MAG: DUF6481 family protein [Rhodospirillaceae bacterium]
MQKTDNLSKSKSKTDFGDRMKTAADARKALLEKWRLMVEAASDPAVLEQQAIQQAAAVARAERDALRAAKKEAAKAQAIADRKAAQEAVKDQLIAEEAAREAAAAESAAARLALSIQGKAARDARYAARKARR